MAERIATYSCRICVDKGTQKTPCSVTVPYDDRWTPAQIGTALSCLFLNELGIGPEEDASDFKEVVLTKEG
jgi:hypothetical protein